MFLYVSSNYVVDNQVKNSLNVIAVFSGVIHRKDNIYACGLVNASADWLSLFIQEGLKLGVGSVAGRVPVPSAHGRIALVYDGQYSVGLYVREKDINEEWIDCADIPCWAVNYDKHQVNEAVIAVSVHQKHRTDTLCFSYEEEMRYFTFHGQKKSGTPKKESR